MTMRSVGVMQEWTRSEKLQARSARFEHEAEAAQASRQLALVNLQRDTAIAWLDMHFQQRMRDVLQRQRDEAALQIQAAEASYRAGRGARADVFAARSEVAQIEDRIAATERDLAAARIVLARWVGPLPYGALATPPSLNAVRLSDEALDADIAHDPQIEVMLRQEAVAQADADAARANKRPDVSVELMYSQRGPAYSNMVSVNVPSHCSGTSGTGRIATWQPNSPSSSRCGRSGRKRHGCAWRKPARCCSSGAPHALGCPAMTKRCCPWQA